MKIKTKYKIGDKFKSKNGFVIEIVEIEIIVAKTFMRIIYNPHSIISHEECELDTLEKVE